MMLTVPLVTPARIGDTPKSHPQKGEEPSRLDGGISWIAVSALPAP